MVASWRLAGALLVGVGTFGGCMLYGEIGYDCDPSVYEDGHLGPDGKPDFCHRRDRPDAGGCAAGSCAETPFYWDGPALLWSGPAGTAPECPSGPTGIAWEGHADLVAPATCEACTCEPSTGSCALPSKFEARTNACSVPGGVTASFDAPFPWDGQCDTAAQLPPGAASSLTIEPLKVTENGCTAGPPVAAKIVSAYWATDARACHGPEFSPCQDKASACIPTEDPPEFRVCITKEGTVACPAFSGAIFTEQHIFYQGINDDRECSTCSCGPPTGSVCTATVSIYTGGMCGAPHLDQVNISSVSSKCLDIQPPGQALGSKDAGPTKFTPGTCHPIGGEPKGSAAASDAKTYCCRPLSVSPPPQ